MEQKGPRYLRNVSGNGQTLVQVPHLTEGRAESLESSHLHRDILQLVAEVVLEPRARTKGR